MSNREDLITFSEAARIRAISPQAIDDYVKRAPLEVIEKDGRKFLMRSEVVELKKGQSGRKPTEKLKNIPEKKPNIEELSEQLKSKHQNPEKHFDSLFSVLLPIRRIYKNAEVNDEVNNDKEVFSFLTDKTYRKNKSLFRRKFLNYERKFHATTFLNDRIIVERVYTDSKIQSFFEYVLKTPEIWTEEFDFDKAFAGFITEFLNEFSWLIDEITALRAVKKLVGRKTGIEGLSRDTRRAYELWVNGKSGLEIANELYPEQKYVGQRREMVKVTRNLQGFAKQNPDYFSSRTFNKSEFEKGWKKK